jgi:hypothetical protein
VLYNEGATRFQLLRDDYDYPWDSVVSDISSPHILSRKCIPFLTVDEYMDVLLRNPKGYTRKKPESTMFEDLMWGLGTNIGSFNMSLGDKFEDFARNLKKRLDDFRRDHSR